MVVCENCRRNIEEVRFISIVKFRKSKYVRMTRHCPDDHQYQLCRLCQNILLSSVKDTSDIWAVGIKAMIEVADIEEALLLWKFFPVVWREWWYDYFEEIQPTIPKETIPIYTVDMTKLYNSFWEHMTPSRMKETKWTEFEDFANKMLSVPTLRCPWGCSEFIPRGKKFPIDHYLQQFMSQKVLFATNQRECHFGIRKDILCDPDIYILLNKEWKCQLGIYVDTMGVPHILTCRYHSFADKLHYLHPPRNPYGPIAFRGDHQCAMVAAVPRVLSSFRRNQYTNSYRICKVEGNYNGIDSINLSGSYRNMFQNAITQRRNYLTLLGRPLTLNHCTDGSLANITKNDVQTARCSLTRSEVENFKLKYGYGSSYIAADAVFEAFRKLKLEGYAKVSLDEGEIRSFNPVWPNILLQVSEYGNKFGYPLMVWHATEDELSQFESAPELFFLMNCIHMIPELWSIANDCITSVTNWLGWALQFLYLSLYGGNHAKVRKQCYPFHIMRGNGLAEVIKRFRNTIPDDENLSRCEIWQHLFVEMIRKELMTVSVNLINVCAECNIIAVLPDENSEDSDFNILRKTIPGFELRFVGTYDNYNSSRTSQKSSSFHAEIYVKHRNCEGFWWYVRNGRNVTRKKLSGDAFVRRRNTIAENVVICIFVREHPMNFCKVQKEMFEMQGGQTKVRCGFHNVPLVLLPKKGTNNTFHDLACNIPACNLKQDVGCTCMGCRVGICAKHQKEALKNDTLCLIPNTNEISQMSSLVNMQDGYNANDNDMDVDDETSNIDDISDDADNLSLSTNSCSSYGFEGMDMIDNIPYYIQDENDSSDFDSDDENNEYNENDSIISSEDSDSAYEIEREDNDTNHIPTTGVGSKACNFDPSSCIEKGQMIPNHVLLNVVGNLLLRRHNKLKANRKAKSFLQRLASVADKHNVPLLYPEGTVYPGTFWLEADDSTSVIGAIPCCCLMDDIMMKNFGMASLYDHTRTRLLDPSIMTSTDLNYMFFCWDMVANLGLRGVSTELVLRRGFAEYIKKEGLKVNTNDPLVYDSHAIDSRKTVNQLANSSARDFPDLFITLTGNEAKTPAISVIHKWVRSPIAMDALLQCLMKEPMADIMEVDRCFDPLSYDFIRNELEESAGIYIVRSWNEFMKFFLEYLQYGKDSPLLQIAQSVSSIWARAEIQNDQDGKIPHFHLIVSLSSNTSITDKDTNQIRWRIGSFISSCGMTFANNQEESFMKERGIIPDYSTALANLKEEILPLQIHHCTKRCLILRRTKQDDGTILTTKERICKCPDYRQMSQYPVEQSFPQVSVQYSSEALNIMEEIGMISLYRDRWSEPPIEKYIPTKDFYNILWSDKHLPACASADAKMSPFNPVLSAMLRSSTNVQMITHFGMSRYLAKYVAEVDKSEKVVLSASTISNCNDDTVKVSVENGYNTKITSNRLEAKQQADCTTQQNNGKQFRTEGRKLSLAEVVMQMLQYKVIHTSHTYVFVPTAAMAERAAIRRKKIPVNSMNVENSSSYQVMTINDLDPACAFPGYIARKRLPPERQFTTSQVITFLDSMFSTVYTDKTTKFSLRPPELLFFRSYPKYLAWFVSSKLKGTHKMDVMEQAINIQEKLTNNMKESLWIDGNGDVIKVRRNAVTKLYRYICNCKHEMILNDFRSQHLFNDTLCLIRDLHEFVNIEEGGAGELRCTRSRLSELNELAKRFIANDAKERNLPIYWFNPVRPSFVEPFLYHILLSMGSFETEVDLCLQGNTLKAFQYARLIPVTEDFQVIQESVNNLARLFIKEQLCYYPLASDLFSKYIVQTVKALRNTLLYNSNESSSMPSACFTQLRQQCSEEVEDYLTRNNQNLLNSLINHLKPLFKQSSLIPSFESIQKSIHTRDEPTPFHLSMLTLKGNFPDEESRTEHDLCYKEIDAAIKRYKEGSTKTTRPVCFVGGGGVGKTVDLRVAGLKSMCEGLNVISSTLTGKRGAENAGEHLHVRFRIPINNNLLIAHAAEKALRQLLKEPKKFEVLRRLDVLLLDELGQIDGRTMAILNLLMQRIRHSSVWMGGILVFATMDIKQCLPIEGIPAIFSPVMLFSFKYVLLTVPIRTTDPILRELQKITRMSHMQLLCNENEIKKKFFELMSYANFVDSIEDKSLPQGPDVVYCFAYKETCRQVEYVLIQKLLKDKEGQKTPVSICSDWEETKTQVCANPASSSTSKQLDRLSKVSRTLVFAPFQAFELTYNDKAGTFYNGNLCILLDHLPTQEQINNYQEIELLRAPHGNDTVPKMPVEEDTLLSLGWQKIRVKMEPKKIYNISNNNGMTAHRCQYGLRHRISVTIHSLMGSTVKTLISQVTNKSKGTLWDPSMAVVLLSRTRFIKDMFFIGSHSATCEALWSALTQGGQYHETMDGIMDSIIHHTPIQLEEVLNLQDCFHYQSIASTIPKTGEYVVYMIVSLHSPCNSYIGYTKDLRKRINRHNSIWGGSKGTGGIHTSLAPWVLAAYVYGFNGEKHKAMQLEGSWRTMIERIETNSKHQMNPMNKIHKCESLLEENYQLIICCNITHKQ